MEKQARAAALKRAMLDSAVYVRVAAPALRVFESPDLSSRVVGTLSEGEHHVLLESRGEWLNITFHDSAGWVERRYTQIAAKPQLPVSRRSAPTAVLVTGAVLLVAIGAAALASMRRRLRRSGAKGSAIIVARKAKYIKNLMIHAPSTLEECFAEISFVAHRAQRIDALEELILHKQPDVVIVDWKFSRTVARDIEALLLSRASTSNTLVVFYNVPDPGAMQGLLKLGNVHYLGAVFTDQELFAVVTPKTVSGRTAKFIRKSVQAFALEGEIAEGALSPVLQLIETGGRSGCLFVDDEQPRGMIFFENGAITHATSRNGAGRDAVDEMLGMTSGTFRFDAERRSFESNCRIPIMQVLMEWAQKQDEGKRGGGSGGIDFE